MGYKKVPFVPRKIIDETKFLRKIDEDINIVENFNSFNYGTDEIVLVPTYTEKYIRNLTPEEVNVKYVKNYGVYRKIQGDVKIAVFDLDIYRGDAYLSLESALKYCKRICNILSIPISIKYSGRKGLHMFFGTDASMEDIKKIANILNILIGAKLIDVALISNTKLVPSIYSPHRKTGRYNISVKPNDSPHKIMQLSKDVVYRGEEIAFVSKKEILDLLEDIKSISHEKYEQLFKENQMETIKYIVNTDRKIAITNNRNVVIEGDALNSLIAISPPCIAMSLSDSNPEHNVRWIITATLFHLGLQYEDVVWILSRWFSNFDEKISARYINYIMNKYKKPFSCQTFRKYGVCPYKENKCGVKFPIHAYRNKILMLDEIDVKTLKGVK